MLLWILGYYFHFIAVPKPEIYQYITLTLIAIIQPTVIFLTIKRNYDSSNHLAEQLEISLNETEIHVCGESFYTEISWEKLFKIDEVKNWFLIYQNTFSAILISKRNLTEQQIGEVRKILRSIPNVPVHLKEGD